MLRLAILLILLFGVEPASAQDVCPTYTGEMFDSASNIHEIVEDDGSSYTCSIDLEFSSLLSIRHLDPNSAYISNKLSHTWLNNGCPEALVPDPVTWSFDWTAEFDDASTSPLNMHHAAGCDGVWDLNIEFSPDWSNAEAIFVVEFAPCHDSYAHTLNMQAALSVFR